MNIQTAEKAIRHSAYTAFILSSFLGVLVIVALTIDLGRQWQDYNNPVMLFVVLIAYGASYAIWRKSRAAAVCVLLLIASDPFVRYAEYGSLAGFIIWPVYMFFLARGTYATFVYHRLRRAEDPAYNKAGWLKKALQGAGVFVAVAFMVLVVIGSYNLILRSMGRQIGEQSLIAGASGWYNFSTPDDKWVLPTLGSIFTVGSFEDGADLELFGPDDETWVMVYAVCNGSVSLDDIVSHRQNTIAEQIDEFEAKEERSLLPGTLTPVSFTRYQGKIPLLRVQETWWVATIDLDKAYIEAMGYSATGADREIEEFVKSIRLLTEEEVPCSDS